MAEANSLIYLVYSLLALAANDTPTTDPSLKVWETTSEPSVTDSWHHESQRYTGRYNDGSCPSGEEWSDCDANCQETCENVGEQVICPRMCVPGCVCSEPGTVRDSDGSCVYPPLCKGTHEAPVTRSHDWDNYSPYSDDDYTFEPVDEVDPDESHRSRVTKHKSNSRGCPRVSLCSKSCKKSGHKRGGICVGTDRQTCQCYKTNTTDPSTFNPDEVDPYTRYPSVDPDEVTRATPEPKNRGCPISLVCVKSCLNQGYKGGKCTGRDKLDCQCSNKSLTRHSAVDPDEIDPYTKFPNVDRDEVTPETPEPVNRVDPDEIDPVTRDPRIRVDPDEIDPVIRDPRSRYKLNSGKCISQLSCNTRCKQVGFRAGLCYGRNYTVCQCYNTAPKPYSTEDPDKLAPHTRFPSVDPDEDDRTDEYPRYTLNPDDRDRAERDPVTDLTSNAVCPDDMKCFKECQKKGRKWGSCVTKHQKTTCDCFP